MHFHSCQPRLCLTVIHFFLFYTLAKLSWKIFSRVHATQKSVRWSVGRMVCNTRRSWVVFAFMFLPKCLANLFHHCSCPAARDLGSRVAGLVYSMIHVVVRCSPVKLLNHISPPPFCLLDISIRAWAVSGIPTLAVVWMKWWRCKRIDIPTGSCRGYKQRSAKKCLDSTGRKPKASSEYQAK